mmetsp:Transcript_6432/g.7991  ORF Transcript_6432/g.7991 Transcript_6432/m.7991 type:complete len:190 (+) Transcript_6432:60-629(+)|eukprot:CAMPEP_0203691092 /NCGR_PEP_ID=MMETSP0091-20130426/3420_1 /ASSEMBLY_ACC=CAM_ASM_001089 /TAXON_ID=426623 /ORGANISM="Chaetoceros affinis, Strain CCMP159" /LENGTH=189 /DNA_ID=CAMNT_0050561471 /DNA_START=44 /DNA_END=613 /DNA_ORIENTATION=+
MKFSVFTLSLLSTAAAYTPTQTSHTATRRDAFAKVSAGFGVAAALLVQQPSDANALELCPPKANNCVRTTWSPPSGSSKDEAVAALRDAIGAYPQAGQSDVDGGGWSIAEDDLDGSGAARVEYKSSGKGNFAKFFNGGKPFVDDLKLEVESSGVVQVKSQSRVGDSDFGVNKKRVDYLAAALKGKGWSV